MDLLNPFEERVLFGKAYPLAPEFGSNVRVLRALVPTGRNLGHGLDLKHVSGPRSGGPATRLERYRGKHTGGVGKAFGLTRAGKQAKGAANAVRQIQTQPKATKVAAQSFAAPTPKLFGNSGSKGSRLV